jgi:hypothetical protein
MPKKTIGVTKSIKETVTIGKSDVAAIKASDLLGDQPKIAAATGTASTAGNTSKEYVKLLEQAQVDAINEAAAKGITDPEEIKKMKAAARDRVKKAHNV